MTAIILALLKQKAAGKVLGLLVSKTQLGASAGATGGLMAALPGALAGEPAAIGAVVLIIGGWLGALYGRWKAAKPIG